MNSKVNAVNIIITALRNNNSDILLEKLEKYLMEEDIPPLSNKEILTLNLNTYSGIFEKLGCLDKNQKVIFNEAGEVLKKLTLLITKPHGKNAIDFFIPLKRRYSFFKEIGVPESFSQKDIETKIDFPNNIYEKFEDIIFLLMDNEELALKYIEGYNKFISINPFIVSLYMMFAILECQDKSVKYSKEITKIYGSKILQIKMALEKSAIHLFKYLFKKVVDDENAIEKYGNPKLKVIISQCKKGRELNLVPNTTLMAENILKFIMDKSGDKTVLLKEISKAAINLDRTNFIFFCKSLKTVRNRIKKFGLDSSIEIEYILNSMFSTLKLPPVEFCGALKRVVREEPEMAKKSWENEYRAKEIRGLVVLGMLLHNDLLSEEEKERYIPQGEELILHSLKNVFLGGRYECFFPNKNMESFEFLKKKNFDKNIRVHIDYSGSYPNELVQNLPRAIIFLAEYSLVAKNALDFLSIVDNYTKHSYRENLEFGLALILFKDLITKGNIYKKLFHLNMTYKEIFEQYLSQHTIPKAEKNLFLEFAIEHKEDIYKFLKENKFDNYDDFERVYEILFESGKEEFNDYTTLLYIAENSSPKIVGLIEEKLISKEDKVKDFIISFRSEESFKKNSKKVRDMVDRLLRFWNNEEIGEELSKAKTWREVNNYLEKFYSKGMEKKIPYFEKIDFSKIRGKNSDDEFVDERLIKFYISEYMSLGDLFKIKSCEKIAEVVNIEDLKKLLFEIFDIWISGDNSDKYKNILIPLTLISNEKELGILKKQMEAWLSSTETRGVKNTLACHFIKVLGLREDKNSLLFIENLSRKHKKIKIKETALETLERVAQKWEISLDELSDFIIPDFEFVDRVRYFDYGERKIKTFLDGNLKILLFNEQGKEIKSLPKANEKYGDCEELVLEAKETLKNIKKEIGATLNVQKDKMIKALLFRKEWSVTKWKKQFIDNVIMNIFATGLIWEERDSSGALLGRFRYMEDGTYSDVEEEEYFLQKDSIITFADLRELHRVEKKKWRQQFEDYEIFQPIPQLDLPIFKLNENEISKNRIKVLKGRVFQFSSTGSNSVTELDKKFNITYVESWSSLITFAYKELNIRIEVYMDKFVHLHTNSTMPVDYIELKDLKTVKPITIKNLPKGFFDYLVFAITSCTKEKS